MKTIILAAIRCSLMFTAVAAFSLAHPAKANLITNGGFETGDFTGWTVVGHAFVVGTLPELSPHSGAFQAGFGCCPTSLTQSVTATPGASYVVDFWLAGFGDPTGSLGHFVVSWGGSDIFSDDFFSVFGYTEFTFTVTASSATTALQFSTNSLEGGYFLDDVSVIPTGVGVPDGGSTVSLLSFALLGLATLRRKLSC